MNEEITVEQTLEQNLKHQIYILEQFQLRNKNRFTESEYFNQYRILESKKPTHINQTPPITLICRCHLPEISGDIIGSWELCRECNQYRNIVR